MNINLRISFGLVPTIPFLIWPSNTQSFLFLILSRIKVRVCFFFPKIKCKKQYNYIQHSICIVAVRIHSNRLVENRNLCTYIEMKYCSLLNLSCLSLWPWAKIKYKNPYLYMIRRIGFKVSWRLSIT